MSDFFAAILAFPTVFFTVPLGVVLLYWLLVLLGGLDLDLFDDGDGGDPGGLLDLLGLGGVPATFALSVLVFMSWALCLLSSELLELRDVHPKVGIGVVAVSVALSLPLAALVVKPLRRFFEPDLAVEHSSLVGKVCTVKTLRVDERYGLAEIADGGAGLLVQVRARPDLGLKQGDRAIVYEYRADDELFWIAPLDRALAEGTPRPEEWTARPEPPASGAELPEAKGTAAFTPPPRDKETA